MRIIDSERSLLEALHLSFLSFGIAALVLSFGFQLVRQRPASVKAAGDIISVDDSAVTFTETYAKWTTYLRLIGPVDLSSHSYSVDYSVTGGCTVAESIAGTFATSGTIMSIAQGDSSYSSTEDFWTRGTDDSEVGEADQVCVITFTLTSTDSAVNGQTASVTATVTDDDAIPAYLISKVSGSSLNEGAATDKDTNNVTYSIKTSDPASFIPKVTAAGDQDCNIGFDSSGKGGGGFTIGSTQDLYPYSNSATIFSIHPVDDTDAEGVHSCTVSFSVTSSDPEYALSIPSITVSINDDEPTPSAPVAEEPAQQPVEVSNSPGTAEPNQQDEEKNDVQVELPDGITSIEFNDKAGDDFASSQLQEGEAISISGVATPNALVKLYIYSEVREAEVTADSNGAWSYTVEGLEAGDHRIEAEVTDPVSGQTSERTQVIAFEIAQISSDAGEQVESREITKVAASSEESSEESSSLMLAALLITLAVVVGLAVWWFVRKRRNNQADTATPLNTELELDSQEDTTIQ